MIIYENSLKNFLDKDAEVIEDILAQGFQDNYVRGGGQAEINSWKNSIKVVSYALMKRRELFDEDVSIAFEYTIPRQGKRIDLCIAGQKDGKRTLVLVELKQWESVNKVDGVDEVVETFVGGGIREVTHPAYQVTSYKSLIADYNARVQEEKIRIKTCSFLHNYVRKDGDFFTDINQFPPIKESPIFLKGEADKLITYISKYIKNGDRKLLTDIDTGEYRVSKSLQHEFSKMFRDSNYFTLIDEQKVAYEMIKRKVSKFDNNNVFIIEGGPGTGKSVLAIKLLVDNLSKKSIVYASKNFTPRSVFIEKLYEAGEKKKDITPFFKGTGQFLNVTPNAYDVVLVDEAHRMVEVTPQTKDAYNQIEEIIKASKNTVFFIDESQMVTYKDYGTIDNIKAIASKNGKNVEEYKLSSQFRCSGSDDYLAWLDDVLQIKETANKTFNSKKYNIKVFDNLEEMSNELARNDANNNRSRIVAGYCWEWPLDHKSNPDKMDIVIQNDDGSTFERSWNLDKKNENWATSSNGIDQIGCIHTSQGLEFDYCGVIIGPDMYFDGTEIKTDYTKRAKSDKSLNGMKSDLSRDKNQAINRADMIIRNTYRTLMTRGQKGCYIYCTDKKLSQYLKNRISYN